MWRLEIASPKGEKQRRFLHFVAASAASAEPPATRRVGEGTLRGGVTRIEQQSVGVVFSDPEREARTELGDKVDTLVIAGLTPGRRYEVATEGPNCKLRIGPSAGASGVAASSGGFLRLSSPCAGK
jgi:hypothetical protein